ncbi:MAG: UDP-glucose 4-epimerase GalE [Euryarchaeota archaeon]|nr:UDP-glucose 4-epimerase GalE [Euryarchaeota archaeon]|tara:strand:+ start:1067 stop:2044 length:978 start_codon:yes stop_codon:yes gene_type:complete
MKVLVTGGAGYIGSHTCVSLSDSGYDVVIVDNLCNSSIGMVKGVEELIGRKLPFYQVDICNENELDAVFEKEQIDAVLHFAALKAVGESLEKPDLYHRNNVGGTEVLLKVMKKFAVDKLVFSSSCTVYGQPEIIPVNEDAPMLPAESPYGQTKQDCEKLISSSGLNSALLRYFNPIGAHPSGRIGELPIGVPNNLIPFLCQAVAGLKDELVVFGDDYPTDDGSCVRDYLHVCDLAEAHVAALEQLPHGIRAYNLGTGSGTSVLGVINAFEESTGESVPFRIGERREGDIVAIWADPSRAEKELGWCASRKVGEALADAWRWQQTL